MQEPQRNAEQGDKSGEHEGTAGVPGPVGRRTAQRRHDGASITAGPATESVQTTVPAMKMKLRPKRAAAQPPSSMAGKFAQVPSDSTTSATQEGWPRAASSEGIQAMKLNQAAL